MKSKHMHYAVGVRGAASAHHNREGFVTLAALFVGALVVLCLFYGVFWFKTWQAGRPAGSWRAAPKSATAVEDDVLWPSPDGQLAWKDDSPMLMLGARRLTLVDNHSGRDIFDLESKGRLMNGEWRGDSRAFAIDHFSRSGRDVTLLLVDAATVSAHVVSDVIDTASLLPEGERNLPQRWEHSAGLLGFQDDGDLQIWWTGKATILADNKPVRTTAFTCQFRIGWTAQGKLFVTREFHMGHPKTTAW